MRPIDPKSRYRHRRETNYWSWCIKELLQSVDNLSHIAAIIDRFKGKQVKLEELRASACQMDICCFSVSTGQGGPELDLQPMESLCDLGLEIWWDIYFGDKDEK